MSDFKVIVIPRLVDTFVAWRKRGFLNKGLSPKIVT